jgi:hypothetical protein
MQLSIETQRLTITENMTASVQTFRTGLRPALLTKQAAMKLGSLKPLR